MLLLPRRLCWLTAVALHLWIGPAALSAERLTDDLLADARDGVLDEFDLPSACLIAGGVTDERELTELHARLMELLPSIPQPRWITLSSEQRCELLFHRLHAELLTGQYDKHASDLRRTLTSGDFNCLSALALYVVLCGQSSVELEIWSQPGHVSCRLPQGTLRVEPAAGQWRAASTAANSGSPSRRITPIQLVGKFSYNRGVELLEQEQFEAGIEALRLASRLDPDDADARTNLLAGLNNWALSLVEQDQPAAAAALIARGLAIDPTFAPLVANERYLRRLIAGPR